MFTHKHLYFSYKFPNELNALFRFKFDIFYPLIEFRRRKFHCCLCHSEFSLKEKKIQWLKRKQDYRNKFKRKVTFSVFESICFVVRL